MFADIIKKTKIKAWSKYLPELTNKNKKIVDPYDYYSVFFRDINDNRYRLDGVIKNAEDVECYVLLLDRKTNRTLKVNLITLTEMKSEIIHYRKKSASTYTSILKFCLDYYTKVLYVKLLLSKLKGSLLSLFISDTTNFSHDRYAILKLLLEEHIRLKPSRDSRGFTEDDILSVIYGRLWHKNILKEEYRVKLRLLLESLIITNDLCLSEGFYYIQSKSVNTVVRYETASSLQERQLKIQKNLYRFIIVLTALLVIIVLVLLALAGIVNLQVLWTKILEVKPIRFLLKFI